MWNIIQTLVRGNPISVLKCSNSLFFLDKETKDCMVIISLFGVTLILTYVVTYENLNVFINLIMTVITINII